MNLKSFSKLAVVSAIALTAAMHATGVIAAPFQIGDPITVPFNATVENTIDVTVVAGDFGTIGAYGDAVDTASLIMAPDSSFTDDPGLGHLSADPASIVVDPADVPVAAEVTVAGAFANTDLYVTYDTCVNLTDGTDVFILDDVVDNLTTPGGTDCTTTPLVAGIGSTNGTGDLVFDVGATITTSTAVAGAYNDAAYAGSVIMYITY